MSECEFPKIWKNETNDKCVSNCPEGTCPRYDIYGNFKCAQDCALTIARNLATGFLNVGAQLAIGKSISDIGMWIDDTENRLSGTYYGPLKSGIPQGIGLMLFDNGNIYYGDWKLGKMDGNGIILNNKGNLNYEGEFTNDMMDGKGKKVYSNGDIYEGDYTNGKKHGRGKWLDANGDKYEGEWVNDNMNGKGKFISADGSVYDGEWREGNRNGKGKFINNNGSTFEGIFVDDMPSFQNLLPKNYCQANIVFPQPQASAPPFEDEFIEKY